MKSDERLEYYLTVASLLAEADAQLAADAEDAGSGSYAEELTTLRAAVGSAGEAAVKIAANLAKVRIGAAATAAPEETAAPFH